MSNCTKETLDTLHDSKTSPHSTIITQGTNDTGLSSHVTKAASAPTYHGSGVASPMRSVLKTQISAPSYLLSLSGGEAPPFKRPGKEARPELLIGTLVTEKEVIELIAAAESDKVGGMKSQLGTFLIDKKIVLNYNLSEKAFLISLLQEVIDYAAQRDFPASKLAVLITIYLCTHSYFKWYYWSSPLSVWYYFKEIMIRHTIEDAPDGQEVFAPNECYDIVSHFHTVYLSNLPLIHILTFGAYKLKVQWPFNNKPQSHH